MAFELSTLSLTPKATLNLTVVTTDNTNKNIKNKANFQVTFEQKYSY